ncbi:hypothetical protein VNO77_02137 [Canavalia gladiata]|uniref:Uncharacterized protein n=1 Tax=Canavalia gladiata TaxID=3824 RepID=A0AAN9MYV1_CANGL
MQEVLSSPTGTISISVGWNNQLATNTSKILCSNHSPSLSSLLSNQHLHHTQTKLSSPAWIWLYLFCLVPFSVSFFKILSLLFSKKHIQVLLVSFLPITRISLQLLFAFVG